MSIYDQPVWELMHRMVDDLHLGKGDVITGEQVHAWFASHYPKIKPGTISAHLTRLSTNAPSRVHYGVKRGQDDVFYKVSGGRFRLYDPATDPPPLYRETRTKARDIQRPVERTAPCVSPVGEVHDTELRERLSTLPSARLDTILREAGVVLEDRLRHAGDVDPLLDGVKLVEALMGREQGTLVFSTHPGEQEGVMMLYRGAMQFIRNPPMHKLMEYEPTTARLLVKLIDCLLQLLQELAPRRRDEPWAQDVRDMLIATPLTDNHRELCRRLYTAGDKGMSGRELAAALKVSRRQLVGVRGSFAIRVNSSPGLKDKGGITAILDRQPIAGDDYCYRIRPVLKQALELAGIAPIGLTAGAERAKSVGQTGRQWDERTVFEELQSRGGGEQVLVAGELLEWAEKRATYVGWGRGAKDGSYTPVWKHKGIGYTVFVVYTYGRVELQFQYLRKWPPFQDVAKRRELLQRLNAIPGVSVPEDGIDRRPSLKLAELAEANAVEPLLQVFDWVVGEILAT